MITIQKSKTADTRSCDFSTVSKEQLEATSHQHIAEVGDALVFFEDMILKSAQDHDFDKITRLNHFHADFITGFKETGWWDNHRKNSRHHLLNEDGIPKDVNLIDVLEMIADCVMAGMGRTGEVYPLNISPELLKRAFDNTADILKAQIIVKESEA